MLKRVDTEISGLSDDLSRLTVGYFKLKGSETLKPQQQAKKQGFKHRLGLDIGGDSRVIECFDVLLKGKDALSISVELFESQFIWLIPHVSLL